MEKIYKATHPGVLEIGSITLDCYVLENEERVFSSRGICEALGLNEVGTDGGKALPGLLGKLRVFSMGNTNLSEAINSPIKFIAEGKGSLPLNGYMAEILPEICDEILKLSGNYMLPIDYRKTAEQSRKLIKAFANVGVIALIDEATGYQDVRDKKALQNILDKYLSKEYSSWAKRFPDEFYRRMFQLKGWEWRGMKVNRPSVVGKYTNDIVYNRLAPGILEELKKINPADESGHRKVRHHQYLTEDIGHPELEHHLYAVLAIMRRSTSWEQFKRYLTMFHPKYGEQGVLDLESGE
jgi:hypothetical protein